MKENLTVQFVYPDYELPQEYKDIIDTVDHADIVSFANSDLVLRKIADVVVFNLPIGLLGYELVNEQAYVVHTTLEQLFEHCDIICDALQRVSRLNVIISDVPNFERDAQLKYKNLLKKFSKVISNEYEKGHSVQFNLLSDRIFLDRMNNCNAGDEHITLASDGKFYVCPAFYIDQNETYSLGNVATGLVLKNPQLYKLSYAPICRTCDAFQCKRCIWLNRKLTLEVNTPSHEQCVMAHLERNQSRELLADIRKIGEFMRGKEIPEVDYLDPFDKILEK
jgi:CXXX repeat peptide maturase